MHAHTHIQRKIADNNNLGKWDVKGRTSPSKLKGVHKNAYQRESATEEADNWMDKMILSVSVIQLLCVVSPDLVQLALEQSDHGGRGSVIQAFSHQ